MGFNSAFKGLTVNGNKLVQGFANRNTGNQRYLTWSEVTASKYSLGQALRVPGG
jgi:hypothetical protein